MEGHAKKCVERYCELSNKTTQQLYKVSTPCIDDHHFKEEEMKSVGELSQVCSENFLKCSHLARIGRPHTLWSVNKLARSITKWTKACDKRLNRLVSYIHHTCEYKQYCHVGNTAKQCRRRLFQDSDFAGDLEDSKSTSGGTLCILGSQTFVPRSWMCKKQTAVSHNSTESEIISLDTGLRLDGLLALELWDLIVSVIGNISRISDRTVKNVNGENKHHKPHNKIDAMKDIDSVPSNVQSARQKALLYVFEDNEAVIKMIIKGRSPTMRHVSRTHRVALDWLFDRINLDPHIQIKFFDTKNQLADILKEISHVTKEIIFCVCSTLLVLELWDLVVAVFGSVSQISDRTRRLVDDVKRNQRSQGKINVMKNIDSLPSNVQFSHQEILLYVFEDNGTVIKMIMKGRSPTMRHVSRTHRVALDWLFDRINLDPKIQIKYIDTKNHLADILTKGNFTRDEWNHLLCLFNISHFSPTICSAAMAKRSQQDSGEERVTAKSRPMMNLIARTPSFVSSSTSVSRGKRSFGNQDPWSAIAEKEDRTEQPVVGSDPKTASDYYHEQSTESSFSARNSKWDDNQAWSSQEWKTDTSMCDRTGQPVVTSW